MPKKISLEELKEKLRNTDSYAKDLRKYFVVDEAASRAFAPVVRINPAHVDAGGLESGLALDGANGISRWLRRRRYRARLSENPNALRIVSEGDSWFQYPFQLDDVIDHLMARKEFAVRSLGAGGDQLFEMAEDGEVFEAVAEEAPHIVLLSGGGNDVLGDGKLASYLKTFAEGRRAEEYLKADFEVLAETILGLYQQIIEGLLRQHPDLTILLHGYDYAIPAGGRWLGEPMATKGIVDPGTQRDIIRVILDRLNAEFVKLAARFDGSVVHVDCRNLVGEKEWHDELHPTDAGFRKVAERFAAEIGRIIGRDGVHIVRREALCPRIAAVDVADPVLGGDIQGRVAARRARAVLGRAAERTEDPTAIEGELVTHFEKVHLSAEFQPARFLRDGAARAASVCRIRTPFSLGTGFLIGDGTAIMTNNHVLSAADVAEDSVAQFGFEIGGQIATATFRPDRLFVTDQDLDFTIVGCDAQALDGIEPIALRRNPATVAVGDRVNIIQHPSGREKEVAIRDNRVVELLQRHVQYRTDTEPGSSGSPVFNDSWELVALHHAGDPEDGGAARNQGIRLAAIVAHLTAQQRRAPNRNLSALLETVPDTSPLLGFFDIDGAGGDSLEVELPDFAGTTDFADIGFWNIEHFNGSIDDGRLNRVADVVSRLSMDVFGLVEVEAPAMERLVEALRARGDETRFVLLDAPHRQDLAVLYDADTAEVTLAEDIAERHRHRLEAKTRSGRTAFPRAPLFARCKVEDGNTVPVEFLMIVVHLKAFGDAESRERRRLAGQMLSEIIADVRETDRLPVILGGDLNDRIDTDVFAPLTDSPDLFALTADDAASGAISFVGQQHRSLIDHIIVSGDVSPAPISGDDAAIVRLDRTVRDFAEGVSDHVPLVMRLVARTDAIDVGGTTSGAAAARLDIPVGATRVDVGFN